MLQQRSEKEKTKIIQVINVAKPTLQTLVADKTTYLHLGLLKTQVMDIF